MAEYVDAHAEQRDGAVIGRWLATATSRPTRMRTTAF
jgi:hypothetical protein